MGGDIPLLLILTDIKQLAPWFDNDKNDDITVATAEMGYKNDWIPLQWVKHCEKYSAKNQHGTWRLLLWIVTDRITQKFCEDHEIKVVDIPPHTTYTLHPLGVCVFQPLKIWYLEMVYKAVQNGDETFSKS